jgi:hypothetical protein
MLLDPFKDGYSMVEMTQSINILPNMYGRTNELGLFKFKGLTNAAAMIEMRDGVLTLVPTTPWGGPAPKNVSGKRRVKTFTVPHMPLEDSVAAADVIGVRAFGTDSVLETIDGKVTDKLQEMKNKFDITMEWRRMGALKGIVLDADGTTVIENYFDAFGVTQKVIDFALDVDATDVRGKTLDVARWIEDHLLGEIMQRVHVLASPEYYDLFVKHPNVEKAFAGYSEAAQRLGGDMRKGFTFGAITIEEYRGQVGATRFIDAGEAIAFPVGTQDTFTNYGAPADFAETVNTTAVQFYARQQNKDFNRGVDIHAQTNVLPLCSRPAVLVKLTA